MEHTTSATGQHDFPGGFPTGLGQHHHSVLAVDDRHVAFCEYNGSVARIICVAVATLANEKLLERASYNDLLLCRSQLRIKRVIDNDLIDV